MDTKHTPGPWSVPHLAEDSTSCNCAYVLAEPYMGSICTISVSDGKTISELGNDSPPLEEAKANARLIAAAPDLLAALISLDEAFCSINEFSTKEERHDARLKLIAARAAIAKATGKEPA